MTFSGITFSSLQQNLYATFSCSSTRIFPDPHLRRPHNPIPPLRGRPTAGSEFVGYPRVVEYSTCGSTASIWLRLLVSLWCLSHKLLKVDDITLTRCEQVSVNGLERGQLPMATPVRSHPRYFGTKTQLK